MNLGPQITSIRRAFFSFEITSFRNFQVAEKFKKYVFSKKSEIQVKSEWLLRKLEILKIIITARISILSLKSLDLADCVLKLRKSKLSDSFWTFLRSNEHDLRTLRMKIFRNHEVLGFHLLWIWDQKIRVYRISNKIIGSELPP